MHSCQSLARTGAGRLTMGPQLAATTDRQVECNDFKMHSQSSARAPMIMAVSIVPTLALLASSAAALSAPPASATIASINPCPRRQLLTYVAHTGGGKVGGGEVLAKREDSEWLTVGRVAAADDTFEALSAAAARQESCLLYTSPSPRDRQKSRMPSSA